MINSAWKNCVMSGKFQKRVLPVATKLRYYVKSKSKETSLTEIPDEVV
jgi:hypothetical protein